MWKQTFQVIIIIEYRINHKGIIFMFIEREKTLHFNNAIITFFRDSSFLITKITFVHTIFLDLDNYGKFGFFDLCFNSCYSDGWNNYFNFFDLCYRIIKNQQHRILAPEYKPQDHGFIFG